MGASILEKKEEMGWLPRTWQGVSVGACSRTGGEGHVVRKRGHVSLQWRPPEPGMFKLARQYQEGIEAAERRGQSPMGTRRVATRLM